MARATPREGEERVATKVARPSGRLWSPTASPVSAPILARLLLSGTITSVRSLSSSGPSGTNSWGGGKKGDSQYTQYTQSAHNVL